MSRAPARAADLRVAHLHLRGGTYALARAELEALAGADRLDRDGLLDLAEVRWRTGDLGGAAAAAAAWLEEAGPADEGAALAHVIGAEAAAHAGAPADAARHVQAALAGLPGAEAIDAVLAGIPPYAAWPWPPDEVLRPGPGPTAAAADAMPEAGGAPPSEVAPPSAEVPAGGQVAIAAPAAELVAAGRHAAHGAPERAAVLLALALRADRAAAEAVLAALDEQPELLGAAAPALAYVRAEALRAAGRHDEARIAYASAERLARAPAEAGPDRSPP